MNDRYDGTTREHDSPSSVAASLAAIIDRFGPSLLYEPERLRLLLIQDFPAQDRQIVQLLAALTAEVPQRLLAAHGDDGLGALMSQMIDRLGADPAFDRHAARWAVRTWASALALPTTTVGPNPAAAPQVPAHATSFASVVTPLPTMRPTSTEGVPSPPDGSAAPATVDEPAAQARSAEAPAQRPEPGDDLEATVILTAGDFWPTARLETAREGPPDDPTRLETRVAPPVRPTPPETAPEAAAAAPRPPAPVPDAPPVVIDAAPPIDPAVPPPPAEAAPAPPAAAAAVESLAEAEPPSPLPWWAAEASGANASRSAIDRPRRVLKRVGAALAVGVTGAAAVLLYFTLRPSRFDFTEDAIRPPVVTASKDSSEQPVTTVRKARIEETVAPPTIVPPTERPLPSIAAPGRDASPPRVPSPGPAATPPGIAKAALSPATGDASAASPKAPAITRIAVPRIVSGKPFTVGVIASGRASDVAAIERRNVDVTGRVDPKAIVTPAAQLRRSRSGALLLAFRPIDGSLPAAVELTVVDRAGARSRPRRVDLRVAAPTASPAKAAPAARAAAGAPKTVPAPSARTSVACTRTTCGSVVAVRPVDAAWSAFDVIVRMDDRSIQATRQGQRFRVGVRVHLVGNRYVPLP